MGLIVRFVELISEGGIGLKLTVFVVCNSLKALVLLLLGQ